MAINDVLDTWTEAERVGLRNGDCYDRRDFHRLYQHLGERHGIEGIVYLPSRVPAVHGSATAAAVAWLGAYEAGHAEIGRGC
ncbi:MAG: hypothetical protein WD557_01925 [Dehalococcoidia bacterium]